MSLAINLTKAVQRDPEYKVLHRVADKFKGRSRRAFLTAVNRIRDKATLKALAQLAETGNTDQLTQLLGLNTANPAPYAELVDSMRAVFQEAGVGAIPYMPIAESAAATMRFDLLNPRSVSFLRRYELELISSITRNTRDGIRELLIEAFEQGVPPREIARRIKTTVGLTKRQTRAVLNYEKLLKDEGRNAAQTKRMTERFANRQLRSRAENIARTETIRAASAGQHALWDQAAEQGLLDPTKVRRGWLITPDDRLCPICQAIPKANPDGVPLGTPFQTTKGPVEFPPAHPRCRCATGLVRV